MTHERIKRNGLNHEVFDNSILDTKKLQIVKAAAALFIKDGYINTTTRQICEAVSLSKGGLYQHIHSKEEILTLFQQLVSSLRSEFVKSIKLKLDSTSASEALCIAIKEYILFVDQVKDIISFWYREATNLKPEDRRSLLKDDLSFVQTICQTIQNGNESGEFRVDDPMLIANNIVMLGDQWAVRRWFLQRRYSLEEYIQKQTELVLRSLR